MGPGAREVVDDVRDPHSRVFTGRDRLRAADVLPSALARLAPRRDVVLGGEALDDAPRALGLRREDLVGREHDPSELLASIGAHDDVVADAEIEIA